MVSTGCLLAAIVASASILSSVGAQEITDDTYFYGQSPPVYPSRKLFVSIEYYMLTRNIT